MEVPIRAPLSHSRPSLKLVDPLGDGYDLYVYIFFKTNILQQRFLSATQGDVG